LSPDRRGEQVCKLPPAIRDLLTVTFTAKDVGLTEAEERREMVADALRADPAASDLGIARRLGVERRIVAAVRTDLKRRGVIDLTETSIDSLGRPQPARKPRGGKAGRRPGAA
jgi:hypothetical protein